MKKLVACIFTLFVAACSPAAPEPKAAPPPSIDEPMALPEPPKTKLNTEAPLPASGTRTTIATKNHDDQWDKMLVAGGRLWVVTDVTKWTSGPMYVPASRLWSVPVGGGELEKYFDMEGLASLAADVQNLYVAVSRDLSTMSTPRSREPTGRIFTMPLGGRSTKDLAKGITANVFSLDGDTIYFDGSKMPKDGSKPPIASGAKDVLAFAFDDDSVYFSSTASPKKPGGKNGLVSKMPKTGGAKVVIAKDLPDEPSGLAVDGTHVYVSALAWGSAALENAGIVARVPKAGGATEILAKDQALVRAAWLHGDHVYFRTGRPGRPGAMLRILKTGGAVEQVFVDDTLGQVTMDAQSIFFSNDGTFQQGSHQRLSPAVILRFVK